MSRPINRHKFGFGSETIGTDVGRPQTILPVASATVADVLGTAARYLLWPFDPRTLYITQHFSPANGGHKGLDIGIPTGTKLYTPLPIKAQIVWCGWNDQGYGYMVGLRNNEYGLYIILGHMQKINPDLRVGDWVEPGGFLGWSGSTGNSTGPHLHLEVRESRNGYYPYPTSCIDPEPLMRWRTSPLPGPTPPPPTPNPVPSGWYRAKAKFQLNTYSKQKLQFAQAWPKVADGAIITVSDRKHDTKNDIEWVIMENGMFTIKRYRGQIYLQDI